MSYRNAIRDIPLGSLWQCDEPGRYVRVTGAAATVITVSDGNLSRTFVEAEFRARFQPLYDRQQLRQQFTMSIANLGEFRVYWVPSHRRVLMRSISCRRQFRVPDGATLVGTYGEPCAPAVLFRDLDRLLAPHAPERQEVTA